MIPYTGAAITRVLNETTLVNFQSKVEQAISDAGWIPEGGGSYKTLTTPQGLNCHTQISAGTSILTFTFSGSVSSPAFPLRFLAGLNYRFLGNPFQYFLFIECDAHAAQGFIAGGVPWMPDFQDQAGIYEVIWAQANARWDIVNETNPPTRRHSFRTGPTAEDLGNAWQDINAPSSFVGQLQYWTNPITGAGMGNQRLFGFDWARGSTEFGGAHHRGQGQWGSGADAKTPAVIGWGLKGINSKPHAAGVIWDAVLVRGRYKTGNTLFYDNHLFYCITEVDEEIIGPGGPSLIPASLFLVTELSPGVPAVLSIFVFDNVSALEVLEFA